MNHHDRMMIFAKLFDAFGWRVIGVFVASILLTGYILCRG